MSTRRNLGPVGPVSTIATRAPAPRRAAGPSGEMSQTDARRGELPLIGSLGVWRSTRLRFALSGAEGG